MRKICCKLKFQYFLQFIKVMSFQLFTIGFQVEEVLDKNL